MATPSGQTRPSLICTALEIRSRVLSNITSLDSSFSRKRRGLTESELLLPQARRIISSDNGVDRLTDPVRRKGAKCGG